MSTKRCPYEFTTWEQGKLRKKHCTEPIIENSKYCIVHTRTEKTLQWIRKHIMKVGTHE